jgi:3-methyladenine DNA glycosylase/8-oxoguanine DNA glycosylase
MPQQTLSQLHARARRHLARRDPVMKAVTAAVGACTLAPGGEPFDILARAIVSQLISTAAARTISARLQTACGGGLSPEPVLGLGETGLRPLGLSGAKARALIDLAERASDGRLPLGELGQMEDGEITTRLTEVRGIGVWTAEMFLIFGLGRPDVLPVADLGLRAGVQDCYALEEMPKPARLREIAEAWQPYRSIGTWYIWRSRGAVPRSE